MDGQQTQTLARRYIKGLLRVFICQAKLREVGAADSIWTHMAWMASSFEQLSREAWYEHVQGQSLETLKPSILRALTEAVDEGPLPYVDVLDKEWLNEQVRVFLADFNPALLMPVKGTA